MTEEWKLVPDQDGLYDVSNTGHIRNHLSGAILKPRPGANGYMRVCMRSAHGRADYYIHRAVAEAFCENPHGYDVVNHKDNNKQNNASDNLEWTTQRGNVIHAMRQNRVPNFPNAKRVIGYKDNHIYICRSANEGAYVTGCDHKAISNCCRGIKQTHHGYRWKYLEVTS